MKWTVMYVLQLLASCTICSFAKLPTLHGWGNQNIGRFSQTRNSIVPDSTSSTSDPFFESSSQDNATEFELRLGSFKVNPFESGKRNGSQLFTAHVIQPEPDTAFGGAFISLRNGTGGHSQQSWKLGIPNGQRFIALHRFKLWWMMPCHCKNSSCIPVETQLLVGELPPSANTSKRFFSVFVPLLDGPAKASLRGLEDGYLQVVAETGCNHVPIPSNITALFVAVHDDVHELVFKAFRIVKSHIALQVKDPDSSNGEHQQLRKPPKLSTPDFCKYLGWCTWDSFYTTVNEGKVIKGLNAFELAGIKPQWIILDDGWQSSSNEKALNGEQWLDYLSSLKENSKFNLANMIKLAKDDFGIKYFFCWHAIAGYWFGLDLDSQELRRYGPKRALITHPPGILEVDRGSKLLRLFCRVFARRFGVIPPSNILAFYDDYHRYLEAQGVDGVKVDVQSFLNCVGSGFGGSVALTRAYHKALSKSIATHFPDEEYGEGHQLVGRIIHCMCHDSQILLQLPACYAPFRSTIRGSDDFYPQDSNSHGPHLYSNAFNGLMISRCGLQDWDMFQTNLGVPSEVHAVARAISGGPVYISDRPGESDRLVLSRVVLDDGSVPIPGGNALPISRTIFCDPQSDPKTLLTIWNKNRVSGHGILGAFNIYGSSWNPTKQMYMKIPGHSDDGCTTIIKGSLFPCDCYSLVKELDQLEEVSQKKQVVKVTRMREETGSSVNNSWNGVNLHKTEDNTVFREQQLFAMYLFKARKLTVQRLYEAENVAVRNFEVATVSRVHSLQLKGNGGNHEESNLKWASIGLVNLFNAGGAIVEESFTRSTAKKGGRVQHQFASIALIGRGRFIAYCSKRPIRVQLDGAEVEWSWIESTPSILRKYECTKNNLEGASNDNDPSNNNESIIPQRYQDSGDIVHHEVPLLEVHIAQPYNGIKRRLQCEWEI